MILVLVFVLILGGAGILYKQLGQKLVYIPLSVITLHGHLVHGFRPLSASIPVC